MIRRRRVTAVGGMVGMLLVIVLAVAVLSTGSTTSDARLRAHARSDALAQAGSVNPLHSSAATALLASRQGDVSAAVLDLNTGRTWTLRPQDRDQTASIIKVDILETLLRQTLVARNPVTDAESDTAEDMIDESSDEDATLLWNQIGQGPGLAAYNTSAGLTDTTPGDDGLWGETLTSATDQIALLRQLAQQSKLLSTAAQAYALNLMENIDPGENWGVSGGVPAGVTVALKNGWVPLTSATDWQVNSIGWVHGRGRDYLIAVLTAHDPSEDYGISTIDSLSKIVYDDAAPADGTTVAANRRARAGAARSGGSSR